MVIWKLPKPEPKEVQLKRVYEAIAQAQADQRLRLANPPPEIKPMTVEEFVQFRTEYEAMMKADIENRLPELEQKPYEALAQDEQDAVRRSMLDDPEPDNVSDPEDEEGPEAE